MLLLWGPIAIETLIGIAIANSIKNCPLTYIEGFSIILDVWWRQKYCAYMIFSWPVVFPYSSFWIMQFIVLWILLELFPWIRIHGQEQNEG